MIEIRHLRAAVVTAETQSFTRAAKVLCVKQSALSRRVQALEQMLGVQLFERSKRGTFATENGKAFLTVAAHIRLRYGKLVDSNVFDLHVTYSMFVGGPTSGAY